MRYAAFVVSTYFLVFASGGLADARPSEELAESRRRASTSGCDEAAEARIGSVALRQDALPEAREAFHRALRCSPDYLPALVGLAQVSLESGNAAEAVGILKPAVQRFPDSDRVRLLLAEALARNGEAAAAAVEFEAIDVTSRDPDTLVKYSAVLVSAGRRQDGIRVLDEAIDRLGPVPGLLHRVTDLEVEAGKLESALARIESLPSATREQVVWRVRAAEIAAKLERRDYAYDLASSVVVGRTQPPKGASGGRWVMRAERVLADLGTGAEARKSATEGRP